MAFREKLYFTSANEDGATELKALAQEPGRRLLALTGSGARVLDLLLGSPREVIALDMNSAQNELLRLKIAAYRTLDDTSLLAYLGVTPAPDRLALHVRVARALEPSSRTYWSRHQRAIAKGIWYAGLWERVLKAGAKAFRLIRGRNIDRLFAASSVEEQARIWEAHFDDRLWRSTIRLLGRRWIWAGLVGEPGGNFLPSPRVVEQRFAGAFLRAARSFPLRDSDFASLILRGRHESPGCVPMHLKPGNSDVVRAHIDRIRIVEGGLSDLPILDIGDIEGFSLSDFGSYCTPEAHAACWAGVAAAAARGARVCEREFMNPLSPSPLVAWEEKLSRSLTEADKSFIYEIRAGRLL